MKLYEVVMEWKWKGTFCGVKPQGLRYNLRLHSLNFPKGVDWIDKMGKCI